MVVDSGSDDGTPEAAQAAGARVLHLRQQDFRHGPARNLGAGALPEVEAIVFLVQDAVPQGRDLLGRLERALAADERLGAVTARQRAPGGADAFTCATVDRSPFASRIGRRTGPFPSAELAHWSARRWRSELLLDSVAMAVRGPLFRRVRFRDTAFGEDALLAYDLLWGGWALGHEPEAVVEHGHAYDSRSVRPRYCDDARFFREQFGLRVRPGLASMFKGFLAETVADRRWLAAHAGRIGPGDGRRGRALRWAQVLAQYQGSQGPLGQLPQRRAVPGPAELSP